MKKPGIAFKLAGKTSESDGLAMLALSNVVIVATLGFSLLWQFIKVWRTAFSNTPQKAPEGGVILALGASLDNGAVSPEFAKRLKRGAWALSGIDGARLIVLGGDTGCGVTEAAKGKEWLVAAGIDERLVLMEGKSLHTLENLQHARDMLKDLNGATVVLVTSRWHLERSRVMAEGLNMNPILCGSEENIEFGAGTAYQLLKEAYLLHWYRVGEAYSVITKNRRMLGRIR